MFPGDKRKSEKVVLLKLKFRYNLFWVLDSSTEELIFINDEWRDDLK